MRRLRIAAVAATLLVLLILVWVFLVRSTKDDARLTSAPTISYAALGDSVAAGAGLSANNGSPSECGRSDASYPDILARELGVSVQQKACTSATVKDLSGTQSIGGTTVPAQLASAFEHEMPNLITITVGANDIQWSTMLQKCFFSTCGSPQDTAVVAAGLQDLQPKLQAALQDIREHSHNTEPRIYLTGYYNPLSAACVSDSLTQTELAWVNSQLEALNNTLKHAAQSSSITTFVPVDFSGHDICSNDSWVQGLDDGALLHPTAAGQQAVADTLLQAIQN